MGPKKQSKPAPKNVPHIDNYARISYLYQASSHFATRPKYDILSRAIARNVNLISKKSVTKLSPILKRTICKGCQTLLVPGVNESIEIENQSKEKTPHNDILVHSCKTCGKKKRFPVGKNRTYKLFSEKDDEKSDDE
ncbi:uncharacterized protein AC631_03481 [Debaryomyces fabryi]|uniref:Uncharacterized protein n=1 Tax=Debaryomyces fabryi TaxID=58627 RepID=A0A0V1PX98_9ASCO|nr:uncharacterized protein AC631_03481 [Debaryomyces fabryi]KSA00770.1 hypothetical protein AC631_03481 [Debaryomyces fabryi]CUM45193.1 unnamed protein product [Debaryomyces fabryi]